mmetsp:Transcript_9828/g.19749  ORF Transcript_9828/g.19749 Transcript_9828/m.19749 type:complete len:221 (+) Transcript_9828:452-1114(+)
MTTVPSSEQEARYSQCSSKPMSFTVARCASKHLTSMCPSVSKTCTFPSCVPTASTLLLQLTHDAPCVSSRSCTLVPRRWYLRRGSSSSSSSSSSPEPEPEPSEPDSGSDSDADAVSAPSAGAVPSPAASRRSSAWASAVVAEVAEAVACAGVAAVVVSVGGGGVGVAAVGIAEGADSSSRRSAPAEAAPGPPSPCDAAMPRSAKDLEAREGRSRLARRRQ